MKTPIQELIRQLEALRTATQDKNVKLGYSRSISEAKRLLPKEKQAIVDAYNAGVNAGLKREGLKANRGAEQYYNNKYGQAPPRFVKL